jgi:hypothetical protein
LILSKFRNKMIIQGNNKDKVVISRNAPILDSPIIGTKITTLRL